GQAKRVSPHVWRHTTAVHLLEPGVEVNVIRAWLGNASLETTNRYAEITLRTSKPPWKSAVCQRLEKRGFRESPYGRATQPCCSGCNRCNRYVPAQSGPGPPKGSGNR